MLLVGNLASGDHTHRNDLVGRVFGTVPPLLRDHQMNSRFVGYSSSSTRFLPIHVFGMEVASLPRQLPRDIRPIWVGDDEICIGNAENGATAGDPLRWHWQSKASPGLGDFNATVRSHYWPGDAKGDQHFVMTANAPYDLRTSGYQDEVTIEPYDPAWDARFAEMREWLRSVLGPDCARQIEHYGSTAIRGMAAKPIVDILVEVPSFCAARRTAIPILFGPVWEYWGYGDHMTFIKRRDPMGTREVHVHMAPAGHRIWEGIAFRDYLRTNRSAFEAYQESKRKLAGAHRHDREAYTNAKTELVRCLTDQALRG